MSSETPQGPSEDHPSEPFARGKIVWSRPPRPVFQVGPLPSGATVPRMSPRPARNAGASILSGSMIPQAATTVEAEPAPFAPPVEPEILTPQPEPQPAAVAPEPEPVAAAPVVQEIVVEPEATEPAVTAPPPLSTEAQPAAKPRSLPSVVVTPAIYATVGAAIEKVTKKDRWLVFAGIAAVLVTGAFIWLATLPAPQPVATAATPLVADAAPVEETPTVERPAPARAAPVPAEAEPETIQPRRPTPAPGAPIVIAPVEAAPPPSIEIAPLVVEPPTPAAPPPADEDAPIPTEPQPLN